MSLLSLMIFLIFEFVKQIPSNEFLCVRFRIIELFEVGFLSPATFTVYEYHRPGNQLYSHISSDDCSVFIMEFEERRLRPADYIHFLSRGSLFTNVPTGTDNQWMSEPLRCSCPQALHV